MHKKISDPLADLFSVGPIIVYTCEAFGDFTVTSITPNITTLLGYEPDEFLSSPKLWASNVHPDDAPKVFEDFGDLFKTKYLTQEFRFRHKDGSYRWGRDDRYLIVDDEGQPEVIVGYWTDISERKEAETALKQSSSRFEDFMKSTSDWFWEQDENFKFTELSPWQENPWVEDRARQILGRTRWEVMGVNPDENEYWRRHVDDLYAHRSFRDFQYNALDSKGNEYFFSISGNPVFDESGEFTGYRGTAKEVTDLVLAQNTNQRFLHALNYISEGFALWDSEEKLVIYNDSLLEMSGLPGKSMRPGLTFENWIRQRLQHGMIPEAEGCEEAFVAERLANFRNPICPVEVLRNGRWYQLSLFKLPDGSTIQSVTDIHDLKLGEQRFELATTGAGIGVWESSLDHGSSVWSDSCYALFGLAPGAVKPNNENFFKLVHPEDRERVRIAEENSVKTAKEYSFECRIQRADGSFIWVRSTGTPLETGGELRWFGSLVNIDQQKRADVMKSEFVSTMNHELRTPLTSICGSIDLIRSGVFGEVDPKISKLLTISKKNADRLLVLVNDILDIEKLESGQLVFDIEPLSAEKIIAEAFEVNGPYARDSGIELKILPINGSFDVSADRNRIQQVLSNLASNAVKFSPSGSTVEISARKEGDFGVFLVKDCGVGISEEFKPKLFKRFSQEDGSDTRQTGGTGLGLAISRSIVEGHGGTIDFETVVGVGTTFSFTVPLAI